MPTFRQLTFDLFSTKPLVQRPSPPAPTSAGPETPPRAAPKISRGEDRELTAKARELLSGLDIALPAGPLRVAWNARLQTTAGLADSGRAVISLNPKLREFGEAEIDRTLRHELAHLVAHARHRGRRRISPHGPEWRRACADLGIPGEPRCHDLPISRRRVARKHAYQCPACRSVIQRVRPLRRACACYDCCRHHNGGRYDANYRLVKIPVLDSTRDNED